MPPKNSPESAAAEFVGLLLDHVESRVEGAVERALQSALPVVVRDLALGPALSRAEAAELAGWSLSLLDRKRREGRFPWRKHGGAVRIPTEPFLRYLRDGEVGPRTRDA